MRLIAPEAENPQVAALIAGYAPVLEVRRGLLPESLHFGAIAVADPAGNLLAYWGDPETATFLRSSAKPFQALAVLESGAADRFGFSAEQIALMCASHSGTDAHAELAAGMLAASGVDKGNLLCGTHPPLDVATARRLEAAGQQAGPLRHNCSGKHAGMLALSQFLGAPAQDYLQPAGAVQQHILRTVAEMCGLPPEQVGLGTDGCSAVNFSVPLRAAAAAYARLMDPADLGETRAIACDRIRAAMTGHPELVGGPGRFDTRLMRACEGRILSKSGAEGYLGLGLPAGALGSGSPACGMAIKIADGDRGRRAVPPVGLAALSQLGAITPDELGRLADLASPRAVESNRGERVGEMRTCFQLERTA